MKMLYALAKALRHTPFHPQWLLGRRKVPTGLAEVSGTVLDIGAADRWIKRHLPSHVHYVALDYPATGEAFYGTQPDVYADAADLPVIDASVDGVVCMEVLEHVASPQKALHEIHRALKPGGRAWLSMPFMYPLHNAPYDFQRYTEFGLRRDIGRAHLEVVKIEVSGHAIRDAGLLLCLTIAGGIDMSRGLRKGLLLGPGVIAIMLTNLLCWAASLFWPNWSSMAMGHHVEVRKPLDGATTSMDKANEGA